MAILPRGKESINSGSLRYRVNRQGPRTKWTGDDFKAFDVPKRWTEETGTPADYLETVAQGFTTTAHFVGRRRSDKVRDFQIVGVDLDNGAASLDDFAADPFYLRNGYAVITTASHTEDRPRLRAYFILDRPLDAPDATKIVNWINDCVYATDHDPNAKGPNRVWFGSRNMQSRINGAFLSADFALAEWAKWDAKKRALRAAETSRGIEGPDQAPDAVQGLTGALGKAYRDAANGRNAAGFNLARDLRDLGLDFESAWDEIARYAADVRKFGDHEYTEAEAYASALSAFAHGLQRRGVDPSILSDFVRAAWYGMIRKQGADHYSLKTAYALALVFGYVGGIVQVDIPIRTLVIVTGLPRKTIRNHVDAFVSLGVLERHKAPGTGNRGAFTVSSIPTAYTLNGDRVREILAEGVAADPEAETLTPSVIRFYLDLMDLGAFVHGAKLDPRLWPTEDNGSLGPAAQKIVAVLAAVKDAEDHPFPEVDPAESGDVDQDHPFARQSTHTIRTRVNCMIWVTSRANGTGALELGSISELARVASVNAGTARKVLKTLERWGVIRVDEVGGRGGAKVPALIDDWWERLRYLEPRLTTFGTVETRRERAYLDRELFHAKAIEKLGDGHSAREISAATLDRNAARLKSAREDLDRVKETRRKLCAELGIKNIGLGGMPKDRDPEPKQNRVMKRNMGSGIGKGNPKARDFQGKARAKARRIAQDFVSLTKYGKDGTPYYVGTYSADEIREAYDLLGWSMPFKPLDAAAD